ncbi:MAG: flavodoxin family protein [Oscillospiraceae bacterium]|nr:flavodoxin family protein [Oscillospiraceae bacterium]
MKVMLVNGSPHQFGSTYTALSVVASELNKNGIETEIFWIGNKPIGGCIACLKCREKVECVFNDVVNEVRKKAYEADGFVFGSPVHYAAMDGNMTAFMDRLFYSEFLGNGNKAFYMKPAAGVTSARRAGTTQVYDQFNKYFGLHQMPIVSSRYWNEVYGANADQAKQDVEGMFTMRVLGRNMAYMLKAFEAAKNANVPLPETEPAVFMNFIR